MLQAIAKSALDLDALGSARALFRFRQPVNLFTTLKTVKGLLYLVPPRTSRIGATVRDYLAHTAAKLPLLKI